MCLKDEKAAAATVRENLGLTEEHSTAIVALGKTLKVDDPGIFLAFRSGPEIRRALTSRMTPGGPIVVNGRPCSPGHNQNIQNWVNSQLPGNKEPVPVGESALAIANFDAGRIQCSLFDSVLCSASFCYLGSCKRSQ